MKNNLTGSLQNKQFFFFLTCSYLVFADKFSKVFVGQILFLFIFLKFVNFLLYKAQLVLINIDTYINTCLLCQCD
jgi:hypothetical protein